MAEFHISLNMTPACCWKNLIQAACITLITPILLVLFKKSGIEAQSKFLIFLKVFVPLWPFYKVTNGPLGSLLPWSPILLKAAKHFLTNTKSLTCVVCTIDNCTNRQTQRNTELGPCGPSTTCMATKRNHHGCIKEKKKGSLTSATLGNHCNIM